MTEKNARIILAVDGGADSTHAVAEVLGLPGARSVGGRAIGSLVEKGYLKRLKDGALRATAQGRKAAQSILATA